MSADRDPSIELRLLGGFALIWAGRAVPVSPSAQRLMALLALRGANSRPRLAGTLWPDEPEARALAALRSVVWRLHRATITVTAPDEGRLRLPPGTRVDADEPVRALGGFATGSAAAWPELLPGWTDDWVTVDRERVRQTLIHAIEGAAAEAITGGDATTGLRLARAAVRAGPLRESGHRLVVRAHLALGDADAARQHFDAVRQLLRRELGITPTPGFRRLLAGSGSSC
jgi:DNA-binding SARP family transcriptional activator